MDLNNHNSLIFNNQGEQGKKRKLSSAFRSNTAPCSSSNNTNVSIKRIFIQPEKENISAMKGSSSSVKGDNAVDEDILYEICFLCETQLDSFTDAQKETHLNECLDQHGVDRAELSKGGLLVCGGGKGEGEDRGLRLKEFFCVLCDVNLSRKKLLDRCLHLKKCAKDHQMSTKQLIQFISPEDPEGEEEQENEQNDENETELLPVNKGEGPDIIDLLSEEEGESENSLPSGVKNAWSILMASSKQQTALMKGGFETKKKKTPSATTTTTTSNTTTNKPRPKKPPSAKSTSNTIPSEVSAPDASVNRDVRGNNNPPKFPRFRKKALGGAAANNNKTQFGGNGSSYAPAYKKVQCGEMTYPIIVDGFQYSSSLLSDCYFLTHFHSDHYTGLTKDFNCGSIYCSPTTANLVKLRLKLNTQHLIALDLETKYTITVSGVDVEVIFTDANHCPGAVCVYFKFPNGRIILHTGDFRWTDQLLRRSSILRALSASSLTSNDKNLVVYLDTTYCDANYDFPHQDLVINAVIDCVREENKRPGAMFVFGAYSIGKERVFMAVAHELNCKVFVDTSRWRAMCCYDWPVEEKARLTTDPSLSNIWVLSMNQINFNHLDSVRKKKPTCNRIVAFQPTGWTFSSAKPSAHNSNNANAQNSHDPATQQLLAKYPFVNIRKKEGNTIYSLPYSEHSSFSELLQFVRTFRPSRIIPTVNTSLDKVDAQIQLLKEKSGVYNNNHNQVNNQQIQNHHPYQLNNQPSGSTMMKSHTFPLPPQPPQHTSSSSLSYSDLFSSQTENSIFL